jgi:rsbT co-antagonist protein RsbR
MSFANVMVRHRETILHRWVALQVESPGARPDLMSEAQLRQQSAQFLDVFLEALRDDEGASTSSANWRPVRELLSTVSADRARAGFSPSETARFVFLLKLPIFEQLRGASANAEDLAEEVWRATQLIDDLGLMTTEAFQKTRDQLIVRQQSEMMELSTPVITMWKGVLALPLIGTLDSERTQVVMEALLQRIVDTGSTIAILDITGVPTVDTLVAQHLLKTVAAARLMGADCIISGIRPQIAQTIVHLGIDLESVTTKATLADAFAVALKRLGLIVSPATVARAAERVRSGEAS